MKGRKEMYILLALYVVTSSPMWQLQRIHLPKSFILLPTELVASHSTR